MNSACGYLELILPTNTFHRNSTTVWSISGLDNLLYLIGKVSGEVRKGVGLVRIIQPKIEITE